MASTGITVTGGPRVVANLGKAQKKGFDAVWKALFMEGLAIEAEAKRRTPVFDGALRSSGHTRRTFGGMKTIEVTVAFGGAAAPYAVYVHEGTGPAVGRPRYFPPIKALRRWAKKKLGDENLAGAVAMRIHDFGTRPLKFLSIPFQMASVQMPRRMAAVIRRSLGGSY